MVCARVTTSAGGSMGVDVPSGRLMVSGHCASAAVPSGLVAVRTGVLIDPQVTPLTKLAVEARDVTVKLSRLPGTAVDVALVLTDGALLLAVRAAARPSAGSAPPAVRPAATLVLTARDRESTPLKSSPANISYAV